MHEPSRSPLGTALTLGWAALLLGLSGLAAGCAGEEVAVDSSAASLGEYDEARHFLRDPEAQVWTETIPVDALVDLVNDCYHAGASEVVFAGIDEFNGTRVSGRLAVRLPEDELQRAPIFAAFRGFVAHYEGVYADGDRGQRYLELSLD